MATSSSRPSRSTSPLASETTALELGVRQVLLRSRLGDLDRLRRGLDRRLGHGPASGRGRRLRHRRDRGADGPQARLLLAEHPHRDVLAQGRERREELRDRVALGELAPGARVVRRRQDADVEGVAGAERRHGPVDDVVGIGAAGEDAQRVGVALGQVLRRGVGVQAGDELDLIGLREPRAQDVADADAEVADVVGTVHVEREDDDADRRARIGRERAGRTEHERRSERESRAEARGPADRTSWLQWRPAASYGRPPGGRGAVGLAPAENGGQTEPARVSCRCPRSPAPAGSAGSGGACAWRRSPASSRGSAR